MRPEFSIQDFFENLHKKGHIYTCTMKQHGFWKINTAVVKSVTVSQYTFAISFFWKCSHSEMVLSLWL